MKLSIIIPVYNEEQTVATVLKKLLSVSLPCKRELVVVNDGSTDQTKNILIGMEKNYPGKIKCIHLNKNLGKGTALRTGLKNCTGDYILIQDADLEYDPDEIPSLLAPILMNKTLSVPIAVYGSRFMKKQVSIPFLYYLGNKFLTFITNFLYGSQLTDMETGYKLIPGSLLRKTELVGDRFEIEPELTVTLLMNRIPIKEIPISYQGRTHLAGKKLTPKDAFGAIRVLLLHKFTPRTENYS